MPKTVREIAEFIKGEVLGDGGTAISGVNGIDDAKEGDISFITNSGSEDFIESTKASCVVVPSDIKKPHKKTIIKTGDPSLAFSAVIEFLMPDRIPHPKGIHKTAVISTSAAIGKGAAIGAYVVIEAGASVGDNTKIYPFCYVGKNARIGRECLLYPNVVVREEVAIGDRVIIHPGTVIGSDGFGYSTRKDGVHVKIPQIGTVVIEDDVELGACVTVDRARFAKTVIGKGTKVDNLVQIAHNVTIGPNCLIAAQSGISGSSALGRNVVFGGQVGLADHLKLGDFVMVGAQSGITKSFPAGTVLFGYPARPVQKARATIASIGLLPKLFERVRALENKVKELEEGSSIGKK
jgi:UDP-3-O-[3-hydroxymyristoyl] glucosamine N-acyltransferase